MTETAAGLENLQCEHPEWAPWLAVVQTILDESTDAKWDAVVPQRAIHQTAKAPLLAELKISLPAALLEPLAKKLCRVASRSGSVNLATLAPLVDREVDTPTLFAAALKNDAESLQRIAASLGADSGAFAAVAALLPLPFLQACRRAWENSFDPGWTEGYCPLCGAWPAFAEVRGIERSRFLRCGRCGAGWQARALVCPYCGVDDHEELVSLVPENNKLNAVGVVEACKRCLGYVKTFTKLQGSKPTAVIIGDLASVELDVAAAAQGFKRPQGTGYLLNVKVAEN